MCIRDRPRRERMQRECPRSRQWEEATRATEHIGNAKEEQIVTILPLQSQNPNSPPIPLRQKLQKDKVVPTNYGVIKCGTRPDGALVVTLPNKEEKKKFIEDIARLH